MTWTGGTLSGSGKTVIAAGAALTIPGGTVIAGRAIDSTAGPLNWTGGTISGTLNDTGVLNLSGSANKELVGTINQSGTTTWTGTGDLFLDNPNLFNNLVGSTFDVQTDAGCHLAPTALAPPARSPTPAPSRSRPARPRRPSTAGCL